MRKEVTKVILPDSEIPKTWFNIRADIPGEIAPYYSPVTKELVTPKELSAIFPMEIIKQEVSNERLIEIPDEVREKLKKFRPSPLYRARSLEKLLDTPARIYYKYEGGNATGSHKLNTAIAQAYYNKQAGIKRITTETGAGQWGSAISMACNEFGIECKVYMVKCSYNQKPMRRTFMEVFGSSVVASPSLDTIAGRNILARDPDCSGSLGIAISEAVEDAASRDDTNYSLGSVLNHVCMHQTVIGLEAKKQLEMIDEYPDVVIACCGGGSNFSGIAFPFMMDKFQGTNIRALAVEPSACPTLTRGTFTYDYSDTGMISPISKMYTLGHDFIPDSDHAGGLRYHGDSPLVSELYHRGLIEAVAYGQKEIFEAAVTFSRAEGIIPAPESAHAIKGAIEEALQAKQEGKEKVILFCLSGNGYFDMYAYEEYFAGNMKNSSPSDDTLKKNLEVLPKINN